AVLELLRSGEPVDRVCLGRGPRAAELSAAALARGVRVESADHPALDRLARSPHHQGAVAVAPPFAYAPLERLLAPRCPSARGRRLAPPARPARVGGGEGGGLRPLVERTCDFTASIPMAPGVESLNVGVAVAIALYELTARRSSS